MSTECAPRPVITMLGLALVGILAAGPANAEPAGLADQKFQVALGTFLNNSKLRIRADGEFEDGTTIEWEDQFGDQDATRFRLDGYWRFNERHHLRLMYTDYGRSSTRTLETDIEWDGELIPVNATATGTLGFEIYELAYEYDFARTPDRDLVLSAGLHWTSFSAGIRASIATPGGGGTETVGSTVSVDAPLPVFGARGMWHLGRNFYLDAQVQYFAIKIAQYDGSLVNYRAALIWQPRKSFGIGAGYDAFDVDLKVDGSGFAGRMDWTYQGPQIFLNFAF